MNAVKSSSLSVPPIRRAGSRAARAGCQCYRLGCEAFELVVAACLWAPFAASAQLEVLAEKAPPQVFGGAARMISVVVHNKSDQAVNIEARIRLHQTTAATVVLLDEAPWKRLQVLPEQTITESASVAMPAVKAETRFLIQWLEGTNRVFGTTEVLVYPTNLLKELRALAGEENLGVFDPRDELKPLLKSAGVEFLDLEDTGVERYPGKLAIIGPFESKARMREDLPRLIETIATKGAAVVWIQPPAEIKSPSARREPIKPSFYTVPIGKGVVVVVQAGLVSDLAQRPEAQLSLIHFARLALHPEPLRLPHLAPQP